MSAIRLDQIPHCSWKQGLLGLLGGVIALSISACGSSPSATLITEAPSTSDDPVALLRRKHPTEFDAEGFITRWDRTLATLEISTESSLTLNDLRAFGNTLAYSLLLALETFDLGQELTLSYSLTITQTLSGGVDAEEQATIRAATATLEENAAAVSARATTALTRLSDLNLPDDPELAQAITDLQTTLNQTLNSTAQIQTDLVDVVNPILADDIVTNSERVTLSAVAGGSAVIGGQVLIQAATYTGVYSDQVNFCLGLDSLLSRLCALLPSLTPTPTPTATPLPSPSPIATPIPQPSPSPT